MIKRYDGEEVVGGEGALAVVLERMGGGLAEQPDGWERARRSYVRDGRSKKPTVIE